MTQPTPLGHRARRWLPRVCARTLLGFAALASPACEQAESAGASSTQHEPITAPPEAQGPDGGTRRPVGDGGVPTVSDGSMPADAAVGDASTREERADAAAEDPDPLEGVVGLDERPYAPACIATRTPAVSLSHTGCFDADGQPSTGLLPYDVNAPLWSDGAEKRRYLALPSDTRIEVDAEGDLHFPTGAVLIKDFALDGQRLETRLLMKVGDDEWLGVAYAWSAAQNEARLLEDAATLDHARRPWRVPSPGECFQCHTDAAGVSLGPTLGQLDGELTYPRTGRRANQLSTWRALGLLVAEQIPSQWPRMASLEDDHAPVEERARAYLASNCSHCHRRGGTGLGSADYRPGLSLSQMGICNAGAFGGNLGVDGARVLVPGRPDLSLLWLRMQSDPPFRMPPLGTTLVDEQGSALVEEWIKSLRECP